MDLAYAADDHLSWQVANAIGPLLLSSALLRRLNSAQLRKFCDRGTLIRAVAKQTLMRGNREVVTIYLVISGGVDVHGSTKPRRIAGDLVGGEAIVSGTPRLEFARTAFDSTLIKVPIAAMRDVLSVKALR